MDNPAAEENNSSGSEAELDPHSKSTSASGSEEEDEPNPELKQSDEPSYLYNLPTLRRRISIFDKLPSGDILLYAALKNGSFSDIRGEIVRISLGLPYPGNEKDVLVFHAACAIQSCSSVKRFLKRGFSPNAPSTLALPEYSGLRPLELAIKKKYFRLFALLVKCNADLTIRDADGFMPLHHLYYTDGLNVRDLRMWITEALRYYRYNTAIMDCEDRYGVSYFHLCCMTARVDLVRDAIDNGFNANKSVFSECPVRLRYTPLDFAIDSHSVKMVELLLKRGASPNNHTGNGMTPLRLAFMNMFLSQHTSDSHRIFMKMVKIMLKYNGDPCIPDYRGRTIVHECYYRLYMLGVLHVFPELLKIDWGPINHSDDQGLSIFHLTCMFKNRTAIENLLDTGVSIDSVTTRGYLSGCTALHYACSHNRPEIVKFLLERGADVNAQLDGGYTPLHISALKCDSNVITQMLLSRDANTAARASIKLRTPLHTLFQSSCTLGKFKFFDAWALAPQWWQSPENHADAEGVSYFHIACAAGNLDQVRRYLDAGVDVDGCPTSGFFGGFTALHFAAAHNRKEVVRALLERGARVDARTDEARATALHLACEFKYREFARMVLPGGSLAACRSDELEILRLLLSHGAEVDARDSHGLTPLLHACSMYRTLGSFNWTSDATVNDPTRRERLFREITDRLGAIVEMLIACGADVEARTVHGSTVLHLVGEYCASKCTPEVLIRNLVNLGVDVNAADEDGLTPLHVAARLKKRRVVNALLKYRANPNVRCHGGYSSLHYVVEGIVENQQSGYPGAQMQILEALFASGGDANARFPDGRSLLQCAVGAANLRLTRELLDCGADYEFALPSQRHSQFLRLLVHHYVWWKALRRRVPEDLKMVFVVYNFIACRTEFRVEHHDMFAMCFAELAAMEDTWLDRFTTLRDILHKDPQELTRHVVNKTLIDIVNVAPKRFPCYGRLLVLQYKRGVARKNVTMFAEAALRRALNLDLPSPCCHLILRHLTDENVDALIKSTAARLPQ